MQVIEITEYHIHTNICQVQFFYKPRAPWGGNIYWLQRKKEKTPSPKPAERSSMSSLVVLFSAPDKVVLAPFEVQSCNKSIKIDEQSS